MSNFMGQLQTRLDDHARLVIPAKYRKYMPDELIILPTVDPDYEYLRLYSFDDYDSWVDRIFEARGGFNPADIEHVRIMEMLYGSAEETTIDASGRVVIPQHLRKYLEYHGFGEPRGREREVVVIGARDYLALWGKPVFEEYSALRQYSSASSMIDSLKYPIDETVGVSINRGKIQVLPTMHAGTFQIGDRNDRSSLLILTKESQRFLAAIEELEFLLNSDAPERSFQTFFEKNPRFLASGGYSAVIPQVSLMNHEGKELIPDFILVPNNQHSLVEILELKRPSTQLIVGKEDRKMFSHQVRKACVQLREYSQFFDDKVQRLWFEKRYEPLKAFRPALWLVIGRNPSIDPIEYRRLELAELQGGIRLKTYDDILDAAKNAFQGHR